MIYRFFKRLFDVICAFIGIVGTSPIWIISIILTEISDPGPLFYFANRVGKDNKRFKMWKFRSMRVARGANEASLRPEQDRIFWWGKIMRRLKIDELPQLINILNGTMSIVGPRPAAVDQVEITRGGENAIAVTVPCGLTSQSSLWDYIYGDQFPNENEYNDKVLPIRLKLDVYYVKHASFFGDILGFRKTVNRTSLSRAKGNRDYRIFEGLGPMLSMLWIRHTSISRLCSDSINPKLSGCLVPKRI